MDLEKISAFVDGELTKEEADSVLAAILKEPGSDSWRLYQQIGDVLRAQDAPLSPEFSQRFAARLEAEPALSQPAPGLFSPAMGLRLLKSGIEEIRKRLPRYTWTIRSN